MECLWDAEGDQRMKNVEESQSCVMTSEHRIDFEPVNVADLVKPPTPIARIPMNDCSVSVMQGDITALQADVIVNPVDSSLQCTGALGRALLAKGGQNIQTQLNTLGGDRTEGSVIQTSAGQLQQYKAIAHVVCPVSGTSTAEYQLEEAIVQCLEHVTSSGFESVALPIVGIGKTFKFTPLVACTTVVKSLDTFKSKPHIAKLSKIFFCDRKKEHVTQLQDRFESVQDRTVEAYASPVDICRDSVFQENKTVPVCGQRSRSPPGPLSKPDHFKHTRKGFNQIKVSIERGEITKQKTDVIAVTADKNLDLYKGGIATAVLKYGGEALQQELKVSYANGIRPGNFAVSSGGNLQCQYIFYAVLPHWKAGKDNQISELVYKMLEAAGEKQASSVSLPALGTGKLGYPRNTAATAMIDAISSYAHENSGTSVKMVNLVVYPKDKDVLESFQQALSREIGRNQENRGSSGSRRGDNTKYTFGSVKFSILVGDITVQECDAMVCSPKDSLDLSRSGAVCKSLLKKCGPALQDECNNLKDEMAQAGVVVTAAPNLNCNKIFHISMNQFGQQLSKGIVQVLTEAERQGITSIALPALGSGGKRVDHRRVMEEIFAGVRKFSDSGQCTLEDIRLVVYDQLVLALLLGRTSLRHGEEYVEGDDTKYTFGSVTLSVLMGDITVQKCDAIVCNPKDSLDLSRSGAVCKSLLNKCGPAIQDECDNLKDEMAQAGVVVTAAPNLNCNKIFHISMNQFGQQLSKAIEHVLTEAERQGITSIALPALGSGGKRVDHRRVMEEIFAGVRKFSESGQSTLKDIRLVVYDQVVLALLLEHTSLREEYKAEVDGVASQGNQLEMLNVTTTIQAVFESNENKDQSKPVSNTSIENKSQTASGEDSRSDKKAPGQVLREKECKRLAEKSNDTSVIEEVAGMEKCAGEKVLNNDDKLSATKMSLHQSDSETESVRDIEPLETTIKATLSDIPTTFGSYFEDPETSQNDFDETRLLLDGLNKQPDVTFDTKEAALATCHFKQSSDSNIAKVEMAKLEDCNTYTKFLFVHECDIEEKQQFLKDHTEGKTDDPTPVVRVYDPKTRDDITRTWGDNMQHARQDGAAAFPTPEGTNSPSSSPPRTFLPGDDIAKSFYHSIKKSKFFKKVQKGRLKHHSTCQNMKSVEDKMISVNMFVVNVHQQVERQELHVENAQNVATSDSTMNIFYDSTGRHQDCDTDGTSSLSEDNDDSGSKEDDDD